MNLQNMAPNAKRALLLTAVFGLVAAGLYFGAIEPSESKLAELNTKMDSVSQQHAIMCRNLETASKTHARLTNCETNLAVYRAAMLTPLLESYAMGARAQIDPLALGAGLTEIEYEDLPRRALPVPKRLPQQLHARMPVKMTCLGSYAAAASFLLRLEKEMPLVTLQSMTIDAQHNPRAQRITFVLEWPVPGAVTTPMKGGPRK